MAESEMFDFQELEQEFEQQEHSLSSVDNLEEQANVPSSAEQTGQQQIDQQFSDVMSTFNTTEHVSSNAGPVRSSLARDAALDPESDFPNRFADAEFGGWLVTGHGSHPQSTYYMC